MPSLPRRKLLARKRPLLTPVDRLERRFRATSFGGRALEVGRIDTF